MCVNTPWPTTTIFAHKGYHTMRQHQRLNTYNEERASRKAARKNEAQRQPQRTLAHDFWGEYYRLSSSRVTDKTPKFEDATMAFLCYRLAMSEDSIINMIQDMLAEGITHRHPQGESLSNILGKSSAVAA